MMKRGLKASYNIELNRASFLFNMTNQLFAIQILRWVMWGIILLGGGLEILNMDKTPLIYSVSYFNLGYLEHCLGD